MQLVAYGAQDIYLTGNPQITFFKVVYRRHTNFSMEAILQTINGSSTIGDSSTSGSVTIARNGDLVSKVYVTTSTPGVLNGSALIKQVELEIGGQMIDRQYQEWNDIWNELTITESKAAGFQFMTCVGLAKDVDLHPGLVQIPLNFWFCRNNGLALPLIALQYHEVKINIEWGIKDSVGKEAHCNVWCDYIYLDTDERRRFAQVSHEYLIEQIQKQSASGEVNNELTFNHPVKELIWTSDFSESYGNAKLTLNGHDRFASQEEEYFKLRQPYEYHTAIPKQNYIIDKIQVSTHTGLHGESYAPKADVSQGIGTTASGLALTGKAWNAVLFDAKPNVEKRFSGFSPYGVTFASTNKTNIIAVLGTSGGEIFPKGTLSKGQYHRISIYAAANLSKPKFKPVTKRVKQLYQDQGQDPELPWDGTGPVMNGVKIKKVFTTLGDATKTTLYIEYKATLNDYAVMGEIQDNDVIEISWNPHQALVGGHARTSTMDKHINVYSFALKPEEHQPSGTCNFSRIDVAELITHTALDISDNIYAVNYNVLRIMSGMGGLAYSN